MDDEQLTERLRTAFEDIPVPAGQNFLDRSKTPRHRSRPGLRLAALAAVVAVAGFVWLRPGGNATPADAWTAVPRLADSAIVARAEQNCGNGIVSGKTFGTGPINQGLPLSLVDARGNWALAFFTDGDRTALCKFHWDDTGKVDFSERSFGGNWSTDSSNLDLRGAAGGEPNGKFDMVIGHAGLGASSVTVDLDAGTPVTASIGHGYYMAWWPQSESVVKITARDANGRVLAVLDHPHF